MIRRIRDDVSLSLKSQSHFQNRLWLCWHYHITSQILSLTNSVHYVHYGTHIHFLPMSGWSKYRVHNLMGVHSKLSQNHHLPALEELKPAAVSCKPSTCEHPFRHRQLHKNQTYFFHVKAYFIHVITQDHVIYLIRTQFKLQCFPRSCQQVALIKNYCQSIIL